MDHERINAGPPINQGEEQATGYGPKLGAYTVHVSRNTLVTCDIAMCPPPPEEHFVTDPRDLHAREDVSYYASEVRNSSHIHTVCACHGVSNLYMKTYSSPDSPKLQPHASIPSPSSFASSLQRDLSPTASVTSSPPPPQSAPAFRTQRLSHPNIFSLSLVSAVLVRERDDRRLRQAVEESSFHSR